MSDDGQSFNPRHSRKRHDHNSMERKRRGNMKDSFNRLRTALPSFTVGVGEKPKGSRIQILKQTRDYITLRREKKIDSSAIAKMVAEREKIQNMIAAIEAATKTGNFEAAAPVVSSYIRKKESPPMPEIEETEVVEEDESTESDDSDDLAPYESSYIGKQLSPPMPEIEETEVVEEDESTESDDSDDSI